MKDIRSGVLAAAIENGDQVIEEIILNACKHMGVVIANYINLLVPAKHPRARFGFIVMEPEHTPPMSGSNSICVSTVLLDTGLIEMQELDAPG